MVLWRTSNNDGLYNAQQAHGFLVRRDQALMDMAGSGGSRPLVSDETSLMSTGVLTYYSGFRRKKMNKEIYPEVL